MLREGGTADRYARTAWKLVSRDKWWAAASRASVLLSSHRHHHRIAVGVFGFVALFWFVMLSRDGGGAVAVKGESRDEHSQDVKVPLRACTRVGRHADVWHAVSGEQVSG